MIDDKDYIVLDKMFYHTIEEVDHIISRYCVEELERHGMFRDKSITNEDIEAWNRDGEWIGPYQGVTIRIKQEKHYRGGLSNHVYSHRRWTAQTDIHRFPKGHILGKIEVDLHGNQDDITIDQIVNRPRNYVRVKIIGCWPMFDSFWRGLTEFLKKNLEATTDDSPPESPADIKKIEHEIFCRNLELKDVNSRFLKFKQWLAPDGNIWYLMNPQAGENLGQWTYLGNEGRIDIRGHREFSGVRLWINGDQAKMLADQIKGWEGERYTGIEPIQVGDHEGFALLGETFLPAHITKVNFWLARQLQRFGWYHTHLEPSSNGDRRVIGLDVLPSGGIQSIPLRVNSNKSPIRVYLTTAGENETFVEVEGQPGFGEYFRLVWDAMIAELGASANDNTSGRMGAGQWIDTEADERLFQFYMRQLAAEGEFNKIEQAMEERAIRQQIAAEKQARSDRGAYTTTPDKVRAFHELRKKGIQQSEALKLIKGQFGKALDLRTYQDNCFGITGEEPIPAD